MEQQRNQPQLIGSQDVDWAGAPGSQSITKDAKDHETTRVAQEKKPASDEVVEHSNTKKSKAESTSKKSGNSETGT